LTFGATRQVQSFPHDFLITIRRSASTIQT
jgi:hypothetical protein